MHFEISSHFRPGCRFSLVFVLAAGLFQTANASSIVGSFTLNGGGLVKGATKQLCWDAQPQGGGAVAHDCFNINTANGDTTDSDIAGQLATNINNKLGAGKATASGAEVQIPGYSASEPLKSNQYSYTMDEFYFAAGLGTSLNFNPDLDTGTAFLTSPSSFQFTGPGGLNASFTATTGATDVALAQLLSSIMNASGYNSTAVGTEVSFQTLGAGSISVTASGSGIDIAFGPTAVPEPAINILIGTGLVTIWLASRRRRQAAGNNRSMTVTV